MSHDNDDFVLINDDGVMIPAGSEGSYLYALENTDEVMLVEGGAWFEQGMAESREALAMYRARSAAAGDDGAEEGETAADAGDDDDDDDDDDNCFDFREDGFSREYTDAAEGEDEEEEWTLEGIVRRRVQEGEVYYLCQWRYYRELTWESRHFLEEEGHVRALDAYDESHPSHTKPLLRPKEPKKAPRVPRVKKNEVDPLGGSHVFQALPYFKEKLTSLVKDAGLHMSAIALNKNHSMEEKFLKHWASQDDVFPAVLFHGTRAENIRSIGEMGLIVPGNRGIAVENGSVHGVGIYAAKEPTMSLYYSRNHPKPNFHYLLVCAGLIGKEYAASVSDMGSFCVFFDERLIVPVAVIEVQQGGRGAPTPCQSFKTVAEMLSSRIDKRPVDEFGFKISYPCGDVKLDAVHRQPHAAPTYTKRMIRQGKRSLKELYSAGLLKKRLP